MIDNNVDQDEWFNLYLCLGSCWVNKSRYETRYDTRYDTGYKVRTRTKESRSIDRAETENLTELNARSLDTKVELNPDVWGPGLLLNQFRITYWRRISSWTISSSSTGSTRNQDQFVFVFFETNRPGFFSQCFKSDNKVMKFLLISYQKSDVIGRLD